MSSGGGGGVSASATAPLIIRIKRSLTMARRCAVETEKWLKLLGGVERWLVLGSSLDFGRLRFDQLDDVVNHVGVLHMVIGEA